jgi:hypothetical protein
MKARHALLGTQVAGDDLLAFPCEPECRLPSGKFFFTQHTLTLITDGHNAKHGPPWAVATCLLQHALDGVKRSTVFLRCSHSQRTALASEVGRVDLFLLIDGASEDRFQIGAGLLAPEACGGKPRNSVLPAVMLDAERPFPAWAEGAILFPHRVDRCLVIALR